MTIADNFKPYPEAATEAAWKAAKTEKLRDKWNTELDQALRVAQASYRLVKPEKVDVARYKHAKGEFKTMTAFDAARREAERHYHYYLLKALRDLQTAKATAVTASKNVIISKASKAKAKEIAAALDEPIRVLKAVHLNDFAAERDGLVAHFHNPG